VTSVTSPTPASRRLAAAPHRRVSEIILVVGTVVAVLAAFGPSWSARTGVAVAVVAAVVGCAFAWRELFDARRAHAQAMLKASQEHGRTLTEERTRNAAVVDTLRRRFADAASVIERQRVTIAELRIKISGLKGDRVYLQSEVDHRETVISALRQTVRSREAELIALRDEETAAVHQMPRRVLAEHESDVDEVPAADDELWNDGSHPTVVDLVAIDLAMILPNYEEDRRLA
jgi:hypothetical protein